jgi:hypothetical protein
MVDGLHIPIWNRTRKPLANALSGVGREFRERNYRGIVNKTDWNCHCESPPNEYILIKI